MKLNKKDNLKTAKKIFQSSLINEKPNLTKVRKFVKSIKTRYKSNALAILKLYLNLLIAYFKRETIIIEATDKLPPQYLNKIKRHFEKITGKTLNVSFVYNSSVIGGLKICFADYEWDFTIKGRIKKLKEFLHG